MIRNTRKKKETETPPEDGSSLYLAVTGQRGKLKLKGALRVYSAGPGFNVLRVLKVSGSEFQTQ